MLTVRPLTKQEIKYIKICVKGCKSREEFIKNYPEEYKKIRRRRIQGQFLGHFPQRKRIYWTYDKIHEIALKYNTRAEFAAGDPSPYSAACRYKVLDKVCAHMTLGHIVYNDEFKKWLIKEIKNISTFTEFHSKYKTEMCRIYRIPELLKIITNKYKSLKYENSSLGEETARKFLSKLFKTKFNKIKPEWLINPNTGRLLELDGYSKCKKIAFEHQSRFHEQEVVQIRDKIKKHILMEKGIILIEIPDLYRYYNKTDKAKQIIKECILKAGLKVPESFEDIELQWVFNAVRARSINFFK